MFDPAQPGRVAIGLGEADFYVALICRKVANATIVANHYSRRVYNGSTLHLGVWIGGQMLGAIVERVKGAALPGSPLGLVMRLNMDGEEPELP